jgi:hypothetical protein
VRAAAASAVAALLVAPLAHGQRAGAAAAVRRAAWPSSDKSIRCADTGWRRCDLVRLPRASPDSMRPSTPWAILASAALPGSGQALLAQDRFVAYLAAEAYAWVQYVSHDRQGRRERATYRDLASNVARVLFSDVRPVGDFEYYERMEKYVESGVFDVTPGGELDPEPDTTTSNGALWYLARQTFWADPNVAPPRDSPEYRRAEDFYRERAVTAEYRWSWRNAQLEHDVFRRTIRQSNAAFRNAIADLGLVIANHALSTVDALVTVRLRKRDALSKAYQIEFTIPLGW